MDTAWIGVIGALGGVLVGALTEAVRATFSFRREKRWAAVEEDRRRLEMIYEAMEQVGESYSQNLGPIISELATGTIAKKQVDTIKVPWARLRMLVNLYRPALLAHLARIEEAGPKLGEAMAKAVMASTRDPKTDVPLARNIMTESERLTKALADMREAIVSESRSLDRTISSLLGA